MRTQFIFAALFTAALLAGCGGAQSPALPQAPSAHVQAHRVSASSGDLLYVVNGTYSDVEVFTYPNGKHVETLTGLSEPSEACSDDNGNVFVTNYNDPPAVYEFHHGAKKPTQVLSVSSNALSCAVDPMTNNLAVSYIDGIAVFPNEFGTPTLYPSAIYEYFGSISYDGSGNLFVDGSYQNKYFRIWELPVGEGSFLNVRFPKGQLDGYEAQIQWDGQYITLEDTLYNTILRVEFSSEGVPQPGYVNGTVVGDIAFDNCFGNTDGLSWIQGSALIVPCETITRKYGVHGYAYPEGGKPKRLLHAGKRLVGGPFESVTISVPPGSARTRQ